MPKREKSPKKADVGIAPDVSEGRRLLAILVGVAEAMRTLVSRETEIVVHDLSHPEASIIGIVNGHVSNRRPGQSIVDGLSYDVAFDKVIGDKSSGPPNDIRIVANYRTQAADGRVMRSSSVIFWDDAGKPGAAMCINMDMTRLERLQNELADLFSSSPSVQEEQPDQPHLNEVVNEIIATAIQSVDAPVSRMKKNEKMAVVARMHERGLFMLRGSADLVAKHLEITKFTIYNYLEEIAVRRNIGDGTEG